MKRWKGRKKDNERDLEMHAQRERKRYIHRKRWRDIDNESERDIMFTHREKEAKRDTRREEETKREKYINV